MCDCVQKLKDNLKNSDISYQRVSFMNLELISGKPYFEFQAIIEGKKKPKIINVLTSYCAFCGKEL